MTDRATCCPDWCVDAGQHDADEECFGRLQTPTPALSLAYETQHGTDAIALTIGGGVETVFLERREAEELAAILLVRARRLRLAASA